MKKLLILAAAVGLLLASDAWADWGACAGTGGMVLQVRPGETICYNFTSGDVTGTPKHFGICDNVDIVYYNAGDTETLCTDVCTSATAGTCSELRTTCITGDDGDAHEAGVPGVWIRPRLEGGTPSSTPQASYTCH